MSVGPAIGEQTVARPKKSRPFASSEERETVIHLKGSPDYAAWLEEVHQKTHIPKNQIVRLALKEWATRNKHPEPPVI